MCQEPGLTQDPSDVSVGLIKLVRLPHRSLSLARFAWLRQKRNAVGKVAGPDDDTQGRHVS